MNTNQKCPKCGNQVSPNARFCPIDGMALAATQLGGRTIVSPTMAQGDGPYDIKAATRRLRTATASNATSAIPGPRMDRLGQKRELTCLVMDRSASMDEEFDRSTNKLQAAVQAANAFLEQKCRVDSSDEVSLISFNEEAQVQMNLVPLSTYIEQLGP